MIIVFPETPSERYRDLLQKCNRQTFFCKFISRLGIVLERDQGAERNERAGHSINSNGFSSSILCSCGSKIALSMSCIVYIVEIIDLPTIYFVLTITIIHLSLKSLYVFRQSLSIVVIYSRFRKLIITFWLHPFISLAIENCILTIHIYDQILTLWSAVLRR